MACYCDCEISNVGVIALLGPVLGLLELMIWVEVYLDVLTISRSDTDWLPVDKEAI